MVADPLQVARISLLKCQSFETRLRGSFVPRVNEVPSNVDSDHFSPQSRQRNRRSAISAAQVQNPQRRRYPERFDYCFSRLPHQGGNLGKVAFFPQRFIWIHDSWPPPPPVGPRALSGQRELEPPPVVNYSP